MKKETKRRSSITSSKKSSNKLQSINKTLLSKIDNILDDYNSQERITPITFEQSSINKEEVSLPIIIPSINRNTVLPKITKQKPKQAKSKRNKTFEMTDVGLVKQHKVKEVKKDDPVISNINKQIDEMLNNINEIDDDTTVTTNREEDLLGREGKDFRQLINDIDTYKDQVHEEFDEVQYLIKFANNTHKLINRHKNVMTNIFKGAGLRPRNFEEIESENAKQKNQKPKKIIEEEDEDEPHYRGGYYYRKAKDEVPDLNEVFDQLKKINKIKDNLSNIQDDFLGYHQNLKKKLQEKHKK